MTDGIDPNVPPSGAGCLECDRDGGWGVHLRRCAACGHIGCCDSSPSQHASRHAAATSRVWSCSRRMRIPRANPYLGPPGGCRPTGNHF